MGLNNLILSVRWFLSCQKRRTKSLYKESKLDVFLKDSLRESIQSVGLQHLSRLLVLR